ncbi:MAG: asparaginase, partial [Oscillospiraceae bacterium]|nr:asparaginase [Oscillospiraceae bacterium]
MVKDPGLLAKATRNRFTESRHWGHVAVANSKGELLAYIGDPDHEICMRSAAKPIQAINVVMSGADKKFDFSQKELAIMCASHYGEDMHKEVIYGLLDKLNLPLSALLCGTALSISPAYMRKQLMENHEITEINQSCSGKHCGFLSVCLTKGYDIKTYDKLEHPTQQEILRIFQDFTDVKAEDIPTGIDGCSLPVHVFSMTNVAKAYARFSTPENAPEKYNEACTKLFAAMNARPEMVSGTNGFCTEFMKHTGGRFCVKDGAESVFCIGVKDKDM